MNFEEIFDNAEEYIPRKEPWVIIYKGKRLKLKGKESWDSLSAAKGVITWWIKSSLGYWQNHVEGKYENNFEAFKKWRDENIQIIKLKDWIDAKKA